MPKAKTLEDVIEEFEKKFINSGWIDCPKEDVEDFILQVWSQALEYAASRLPERQEMMGGDTEGCNQAIDDMLSVLNQMQKEIE